MADITKLNLYLNEEQYHKLCIVAEARALSPEEVANNAVYGYLAIVDPFAEDQEPSGGEHEILFNIPEEAAERLMDRHPLGGLAGYGIPAYNQATKKDDGIKQTA